MKFPELLEFKRKELSKTYEKLTTREQRMYMAGTMYGLDLAKILYENADE